ncbi:MAG: hypothetical protein ACXADB_14175 [Candidatus Hermodarchaeia archaeon]
MQLKTALLTNLNSSVQDIDLGLIQGVSDWETYQSYRIQKQVLLALIERVNFEYDELRNNTIKDFENG